MGKTLELVGERFGKLKVIEFIGIKKINKNHSVSMWECECDCGKKIIMRGSNLVSGHTTSCGCNRVLNLIGQKFNRLRVMKFEGLDKRKQSVWLCKCDCGNEKIVLGNYLKTEHTQSCGCLWKQRMIEVHKGKIGLRGEKNPSWNPNRIHEQRLKERKLPENTFWRNEVFKRDNYTCQRCNDNTGGNLIAHHIESYTSTPELRFDINNGICFCEKCHKEFHRIYGYGNNIRIQLKEFLDNTQTLAGGDFSSPAFSKTRWRISFNG